MAVSEKKAFMNYVLVTGGVISGVGKGIVSSSIGTILRSSGYHVTSIKIDPYLNIDAGTFSPLEHGEVYVLDDGAEVDLDLGNYERYLDIALKRDNNITTGRVYQRVLQKERAGDYLGKTVQVNPHITDEIKNWVHDIAHVPTDGSGAVPDICIIELGGVISDIESLPFVEALRQMLHEVGHDHFICVHVSPIPKLSGELKTKPTQSSVWELRNKGLPADILMSRSTVKLPDEIIQKLSRMCHVKTANIFNIFDVSNLYQVPKMMADFQIDKLLLQHFKLPARSIEGPSLLDRWTQMLDKASHTKFTARVAIVGKYTKLSDAYVSIFKAIEHAAADQNCEPIIEMIDSIHLESGPSSEESLYAWKVLTSSDCVIIPGGFGSRGIEGKIAALKYCRQFGVPVLGICLGFQLMVVEFCRSVLSMKEANSSEINPEANPNVIIDMPEHTQGDMGGTMRLGLHKTHLALSAIASDFMASTNLSAGSKRRADDSKDSYPVKKNIETCSYSPDEPACTILSLNENNPIFLGRHRHRYEVNPDLVDQIERAGFAFVGRDITGRRMEMGELILALHNPKNQADPVFDKEDELKDSDLKDLIANAKKRANAFSKTSRHPFYVGSQFHPEFLSRPIHPCRLFRRLIQSGMKSKELN
ncbi:CTP synthase 2 [Cichlidogyrus casuarinus]|uniref:CTP synthase n=1 Tax=Cichlidogyrus casuarinus TaxID=1844966 RepID=A0ABD2QKJ6_9PLAT